MGEFPDYEEPEVEAAWAAEQRRRRPGRQSPTRWLQARNRATVRLRHSWVRLAAGRQSWRSWHRTAVVHRRQRPNPRLQLAGAARPALRPAAGRPVAAAHLDSLK